MANSLLSAIKALGGAGSNQPGAVEKQTQTLTRRSEVRGHRGRESMAQQLSVPFVPLYLCLTRREGTVNESTVELGNVFPCEGR